MQNMPKIDYADAKQGLELIIEKAEQMQKAVAIAVADSHGELIAFARMDGVPLPSITIAMNKAGPPRGQASRPRRSERR